MGKSSEQKYTLQDLGPKVCETHTILTGNGHPEDGMVFRLRWVERTLGLIVKIGTAAVVGVAGLIVKSVWEVVIKIT